MFFANFEKNRFILKGIIRIRNQLNADLVHWKIQQRQIIVGYTIYIFHARLSYRYLGLLSCCSLNFNILLFCLGARSERTNCVELYATEGFFHHSRDSRNGQTAR
jgi:hypothetical protein